MAEMKELMQLKMPTGLPFVKIEALVMAVRQVKTWLIVIGQERHIYPSVFTVGTLVEKLKLTAQSSWCHYLAEQPGQVPHKVLEEWLEIKGRAEVVQRQNALASQCQQGDTQKAQQPLPRAQGLNYNNIAKRNVIKI